MQRVLDDPTHEFRQSDGRIAVWVYFAPRALTPVQRREALGRAERALNPRTAARRAKNPARRRLVDNGDLPLDPGHLAGSLRTGASPREQSRWLNAASYNATPAQVRALAALPFVRRVQLVWKSQPSEVFSGTGRGYPRPWGKPGTRPVAKRWTLDYGLSLASLELINVPPVHELGYTGAGVLIAWLDTGFRMTHEALDHVPVVATYDVVDDDTNPDTEPGDPPTTHEHGTRVASTGMAFQPGSLIGPAYGASAVLVRAELQDFQGPVEEDWWVAGLEWAELQGPDLVSSSLGYLGSMMFSNLDGDTSASSRAADMAAARGLLVVNGCGNQGGLPFDHVIAPADGDSVVAVGATDVNGVFASFSSSGPTFDGRIKPDVTAQGELVNVVDPNDDQGYVLSGGTSFSGPFVAAVAALVLERAPFLEPMQVREALRQTASRSLLPDNQYGWGVVDALAAVTYWGPQITHTELPDSEDLAGPYPVTATVTDQFALVAQTPELHYRVDGGAWQDVLMVDQGGGSYGANIPGQATDSVVEYYVDASDVQGLSARLPLLAPAELFSFRVWEDLVAPVVAHVPLLDQGLGSWPPYVTAQVTDDLGVEKLDLRFTVNGGPEQGPFTAIRGIDNLHSLAWPLAAGSLSVGDVISYTLTAVDAAVAENTAVVGPFAFTVVAGAGEILIYDDNAGNNEATDVAGWLANAGYSTVVRNASAFQAGDLVGKLAVVVLSGDNLSPLGSTPFRQFIEGWVAGGGRLLIEGGEVGYAMAFGGDPSFAADVLHMSSWSGDSSGSLTVASGQAGHSLLEDPLAVTPPLTLNYSSEGDQDAIPPTPDAVLVLQNSGSPGTAGALVFDDQPIDPAVQIVYYAFALAALSDQGQAEALVVNAMARLLTTEAPTAVDDVPGAGTRLLGAAPTPFNAHTTLRLDLAQAGPVWLELYDVRGRLVRTLLDGGEVLSAGRHERVWDGRDRFGRDVASGTYLVRLRTHGEVRRGKVALVR